MEKEAPQPVKPSQDTIRGNFNDPRFPKVVGRTRFDSALELVGTTVRTDQSITQDWSLFDQAREMDDVSDRG